MRYTLVVPPLVAAMIRVLSPGLKKKIRAGLEEIQENPHAGKPLKDDLRGLWSYRVNYYRIVYQIEHGRIEVQVIDIGSRSVIYERVLAWARRFQK